MEPKSVVNDVKIQLIESKVDNAVRVIARVTFQKDGRDWATSAYGQGATRADAVEDLAKRKINPKLEGIFKKFLSDLDPKQPLPKASQPPTTPAASGKEKVAGSETPRPPTSTDPSPSTPAPRPEETPQPQPKEKPTSKDSTPKSDGTAQGAASSQADEKTPPDTEPESEEGDAF
jgi:hypothetical protein